MKFAKTCTVLLWKYIEYNSLCKCFYCVACDVLDISCAICEARCESWDVCYYMSMLIVQCYILIVWCKMSRMAFVDLKVDPKYHRHIIGKAGANGQHYIDDIVYIELCLL